MTETSQTTTIETPIATAEPVAGKPVEKSTQAAVPEKKPDELGSQFAALGRREKAIKQQEAQLAQRQQLIDQRAKEIAEFEGLSADELLERAAKKQGRSSIDLVKDFIAKQTGQPSADDELKKKAAEDPVTKALLERIEKQERALAERDAKLTEREKSIADREAQRNVEFVQNECIASATASWTEDGDATLFFEDQIQLGRSVFEFCAARVQAYVKEHGFEPEESDLEALIKAAPKLIVDQLLETPRGKRLAALRAPAPVVKSSVERKPSMRMKPVDGGSAETTQPKLVTRLDHTQRLANARAQLPDKIEFG